MVYKCNHLDIRHRSYPFSTSVRILSRVRENLAAVHSRIRRFLTVISSFLPSFVFSITDRSFSAAPLTIVAIMLAKSLALVLMASFAVAKIPPYIKVCGRRNPELDKCVLESVEGLRGKLREGIPELGVPALEPLHLKGFPISNSETFRAYADNVTLTGLSNFEVKSFHDDLKGQQLDIAVVVKKVDLDADYDVNAKIVVPIVGKGPIHIESENVDASVIMKYKLVKKNGVDYIYFPTMTTKLSIADYKATFKSIEGPDSPISAAINTALDSSRKEILDLMRPTLEKVISEKVLELANKICKNFTYDELHPDTE